MTLKEAILAKVADWRPSSRQTILIPDHGAGWAVSVTADRSDELGCLVWEAVARRTTGRREEPLRAWADRVAGRVTGLLEPLAVVEVDVQRDEAVLRSEEPARRGEDLFYYEVLLNGAGEAAVRRYRSSSQPGTRREQIPFALTHESLAKLLGDVTAD